MKRWTGTVSVLILSVIMLCMVSPVMAATWVVNPDGSGNFTTIQAAVESNWTSGDTILVEYAVYQEMVYVNAFGANLSITGVPSAEGAFPVIDGMNGAGGLMDVASVDGIPIGPPALQLDNGNYIISNLCVTNASGRGIVARAGYPGQVFSAANIEVTENGYTGMNVMAFSETILNGIASNNNGDMGIHIYGDSVTLDGIETMDNDWRGIGIRLMNIGELRSVDTMDTQLINPSVCSVTDILTSGNGDDGIRIVDEGVHLVNLSWIVSTGNVYNGVALKDIYEFSARYLILSENGWRGDVVQIDSVHEGDGEFDEAVIGLGPGNGIGVLSSSYGIIEHVESVNNSVAGVYLKYTDDVTLRYVETSEHSLFYDYPADAGLMVSGAGIMEDFTSNTVIEDCLSYNNWVDYYYGSLYYDLNEDLLIQYSVYPTVERLQISDPSNEESVPTILSWESDCDRLMLGQPYGQITDFLPPARYNDAGGMYCEILGSTGDTIDLAFVIPPEFPSTTAESLTLWNYEWFFEDSGWVQPVNVYNTLVCDERHVGVVFTFPGYQEMVGSVESFDTAGWATQGTEPGMDGIIVSSYETMFAPFWYEQPGGDDPGAGGSATPVPTNAAPGDQQAGDTGTDAGTDGANPTLTPVPTAAPVDGEGDVNETVTMTPAPVGESASPTVPVTQLPSEGGSSDGGVLPWVVLIVVLVVIAGGVYYMKQQK